ncbi:hypothetical protein D9756_010510 [Leucocoprinus leucothites]|uniref:Uncharacterized protein n=1 Tax=Leucocoprinus leucothites TaxID=201217 RepID=A0A8H5FTL0_9AGAR|nr:hypothetical protein D9756_010510 [Leucoagaricus leucothites]
MSNPSDYCIASNTDIFGIGTRVATYAQNYLTLIPVIHALWDGRVTYVELEMFEKQSTTILLTAYGILLSTIIQGAATDTLSNFHVMIVLNLSWMNDMNALMFFLLRLMHEMDLKIDVGKNTSPTGAKDATTEPTNTPTVPELASLMKKVIFGSKDVMLIGSFHLTFMSAVGIWLWSDPLAFGNSPVCSMSGHIFLIKWPISFLSARLKIWSLLVYSSLLVPGLNLILPLAFLSVFVIYSHWILKLCRPQDHRLQKLLMAGPGLIMVTTINSLLVISTENTLKRAPTGFLEPGDASWSFGQILALLLLLSTIRDILETLRNRQPRQLTEQVEKALEEGESQAALTALKRGALVGRDIFSFAIKKGSLDVVEYLVNEYPKLFPRTALHDAVENECLDVMEYLVEKCQVDINAKDILDNTALHKAVKMGRLEAVQYLIRKSRFIQSWELSKLKAEAIGRLEGKEKEKYLAHVDKYLNPLSHS